MWEGKQTKQAISGEAFRAEMMKKAKLLILPCIAGAILILILTAFLKPLIGHLLDIFNNPAIDGYRDPKYIAKAIVTLIVLLIAIGYPIFVIIRNVIFYIKITRRCFTIVEDTLVRKVDREFTRTFGRTHYDDIFYFETYGRYTVPRTERSAFDYSSENDGFYLIVLKGRKPRIMRAYNTKVYEYQA